MKKFFILLLFLLVTPLGLVGCGTSTTTSNNGANNTTNPNPPPPENPQESLTKDWVEYTSKDNDYTVKFPATPKQETQTQPSQVGDLELLIVMYEDTNNKRAYLTNSITYPIDPKDYDAQKGIEGVKNGILGSGDKSTLVSETDISEEDILGKELLISDANGYQKKARIFLDPKGPTLYQVLMVVEKGDFNFPEADAFFDSFTINK